MNAPVHRGVTLLETVLYIGIFSVILPTFVVFVFHVWQQQIGLDATTRLEQTTAILFLNTTHAITEANAIDISTSTLGTDTSVLRFEDADGTPIVMDVTSTPVTFGATSHTVRRLRIQHGTDTPTWITDPEYDVTQWRVDAVRDSTGALTGLRMSFDVTLINATGKTYRTATFAGDTTIVRSPHTLER